MCGKLQTHTHAQTRCYIWNQSHSLHVCDHNYSIPRYANTFMHLRTMHVHSHSDLTETTYIDSSMQTFLEILLLTEIERRKTRHEPED